MIKRVTVLLSVTLLLAGIALPFAFAQDALAEVVEGPLRADPKAYEHIEDDMLYAQSQERSSDGVVFAQATGTSNIVSLNLTLDQMIQMCMKNDNRYNHSYAQFQAGLDPNSCNLTVFADLRTSSGLTAAQIDAFIDSEAKGRAGKLHGQGAAFIEAEATYHVNAAYLVAHAILETGWGTSTLAMGQSHQGTVYYNFFGIGAFDGVAESAGLSMAVKEGWTSPRAAVLGGAQWIAKNYIYRSTYAQPTLYAMKWDYARANAESSCWHQYCTGVSWQEEIARIVDQAYARVGVDPAYNYIIPQYRGSSVPDTNARALYRLYNPNSGEHFYTSNFAEKERLADIGWNYEGIGWRAPKSSDAPVYRLYNENGGEHHYTLSAAERDNLVAHGWNYEGVGWYSADTSGTPLYRQYNPNAFANNHNYTASRFEFDHNIGLGWQDEGVAWYGL
jgi:beta-N-acetylglucosaminidase